MFFNIKFYANNIIVISNIKFCCISLLVPSFHHGSVSMYSLSALDHQQKEAAGRGAPPRMGRSESHDPLSFSDEPFPSAG